LKARIFNHKTIRFSWLSCIIKIYLIIIFNVTLVTYLVIYKYYNLLRDKKQEEILYEKKYC